VYRIKSRVVGMGKPDPYALAGYSLIHGLMPWLPIYSLLEPGNESKIQHDWMSAICLGRDTTLHFSAGAPHTTRKLLAGSAIVNAQNRYKQIPLHLAAMCGVPDAYNILLEHGANPLVKYCCNCRPAYYLIGRYFVPEFCRITWAGLKAIYADKALYG
jgi:hypothetical protein